jgi:hypothetical protein
MLRTLVAASGPRLAALLGLVAYAAAAAWLIAALIAIAWLLTRGSFAEWQTLAAVTAAILAGAAGVTLFSTLAELYGQRRRDARAAAIFAALQSGGDAPPFTLYLRPFVSTGAFRDVGAPIGGGAAGMIGTSIELEAQIERAVRPLGPLICLGKPLEHIGAGRILVDEDNWKQAVRLLMTKARLVIMLPSSRLGTLEEIEMILDSDIIKRTVVIDPPNIARSKNYDHRGEWKHIQQAFAKRGFEVPEETRLGRLLYYGPERAPKFKERLDIDAEDRIERLFRRVIRAVGAAQPRGQT